MSPLSLPAVDGVSHRDVSARGVRFHVAEAGSGEPVLLLHGWPQHWFCWRRVIPLLAGERRLICPDLRGFGWSEAPAGAYDKQSLADDMLALLDALELERVDLIAHDWGAWAGFLMCLQRPERFSHYLALNIVTPWPNKPSLGGLLGLWRLSYQVVISTPGLGRRLISESDLVCRMIPTGAVHRDAWSRDDLDCFADVLREPPRTRASVHLYRTFLLHEVVPHLAGQHRHERLKVPTLLLHGTHDVAIDSTRLGDWEAHADRMSVELCEDSGHFIAEERPDLVAERARALFAS